MSDESTMKDHIEDLMVERAIALAKLESANMHIVIVESELLVAQSEANRFKAHAIHAWFCKETVCDICHDHFVEAKESYGLDHE